MDLITFAGTSCLSFRQLDELNRLDKGSTFRLFKRWETQLVDGQDFRYLPEAEHGAFIDSLKAQGKVYTSSRHLVLVTRDGYIKLQGLVTQA